MSLDFSNLKKIDEQAGGELEHWFLSGSDDLRLIRLAVQRLVEIIIMSEYATEEDVIEREQYLNSNEDFGYFEETADRYCSFSMPEPELDYSLYDLEIELDQLSTGVWPDDLSNMFRFHIINQYGDRLVSETGSKKVIWVSGDD